MTDVQAAAEPVVLAFGRYKLIEEPGGDLIAAAAVGLCERCQGCGCGEQVEPRRIPAIMARMLTGKLKGLTGRGNDTARG